MSYIGLSILLYITHSGVDLLTHIITTMFFYVLTWSAVNKVMRRLQEVEEHAIVCAWCGSVKHAGEYATKVSHGICPNCTETQMKELSKIKENICIQKNPHDIQCDILV